MPSDYAVTRLSITPVKGLMLHHPESVEVTAEGAVCDRLFYLVDETGTLQSCTANPGLFGLTAVYDDESSRLEISRGEDLLLSGVIEPSEAVDTDMYGLRTLRGHVVADPIWSTFFSDIVGRRTHLVRASTSAYDVHPVTMLGNASVQELARRAGVGAVDSRRFRMLIEFAGGEPHVEDSWQGRRLQVGSAVLRGGGAVKRCAATTRDPDSGAVNLQTLRLISTYRGRQNLEFGVGSYFGVYGQVIDPGTIAVGDSLRPG